MGRRRTTRAAPPKLPTATGTALSLSPAKALRHCHSTERATRVGSADRCPRRHREAFARSSRTATSANPPHSPPQRRRALPGTHRPPASVSPCLLVSLSPLLPLPPSPSSPSPS